LKVTVPVGVPPPEAVTVAVTVTDWPTYVGLPEVITAVVVGTRVDGAAPTHVGTSASRLAAPSSATARRAPRRRRVGRCMERVSRREKCPRTSVVGRRYALEGIAAPPRSPPAVMTVPKRSSVPPVTWM
jgi:hypothetical protein